MKFPVHLLAACSLAALPVTHARAQDPSAPAPEDLSQYDTADKLWVHIHQPPAKQPGNLLELKQLFHARMVEGQEFVTRYPDDARVWEARLIVDYDGETLTRVGDKTVSLDDVEADLDRIASAADAPVTIKAGARYMLLQIHAAKSEGPDPALEREVEAFISDFPNDPRLEMVKLTQVKILENSDPTKAMTLLEGLLNSSDPKMAQLARMEERKLDVMRRPLDLKFTAADNSEVDLAKMRGKVVLIDFWATWCGPCMREVPDVVATYNDLHSKGFEVVGISLDQDRETLLRVTQEKGMAWPQYFDGLGWKNRISTSYSINSIPRMWLVNKQGMVVDLDGRIDLREKVEKLLAE